MRVIQFNITIISFKISWWKHCWISRSNTNLSKKESHTHTHRWKHTRVDRYQTRFLHIYVNIGRKSIETVGVAEHTRKPAARLLEQNRNEIPASIRVLKARTKTAARLKFFHRSGPLNRISLLANPLEWSSYRWFGFRFWDESYIAYFLYPVCKGSSKLFFFFIFIICACLECVESLNLFRENEICF